MLLGSRDNVERAEAVRRVKGWVQVHAHAGDDQAVLVTELRCREEGCPPIETVLALLCPHQEPRKWKVRKPVVQITEDDVGAAMAANGDAHEQAEPGARPRG